MTKKILLFLFLIVLYFFAPAQDVKLRIIHKDNYRQWIIDKSGKSDSLLICDAEITSKNAKVEIDSTSKTYMIKSSNRDSCILSIKHSKHKDIKINLIDYKEQTDINVVLGNEGDEYLGCGKYRYPFTPKLNKVAIKINSLDNRQRKNISDLGLVLVDSLCSRDLVSKFYFLEKKDGSDFKKYSDKMISNLRQDFYNVVLYYREKACIKNVIIVELDQILEIKNLKSLLKERGIVDVNEINNYGSNPYKYRIVFNDSLGYGIVNEFNKLCELVFVENIYPSITRLIEED